VTIAGKTYPPFEVTVDAGKLREFAEAVRDDQSDPAVAPLTFARNFWWEGFRVHQDLGFDWARVLHGEQEFEYTRPLRAGERLTGTMVVKDVFTKEGRRGGSMTFAVIETTYRDESGEPVVIARRTLIETDRPADAGAEAPVRTPWRLGAFEDVAVGDEAERLSIGPVTRTDFVRYAGATGDFNPNHHDELAAIRAGFDRPFGMGMLPAAYLGRLLAEWLGIENVRRYRIRFTSRFWPGDTLTSAARVVGKAEDEALVECEAWVENQHGERVIEATVVAGIPRKEGGP
jgi:peroxisomal enoyl-CoA hydratase 2